MIGRAFGGVVLAHCVLIGAMLSGLVPAMPGAIAHGLLTLAAIRLAAGGAAPIAAMAAAPLGPAGMLLARSVAVASRRLHARASAMLVAEAERGPANDRRLIDRIEDDRLRSPDAGELVSFADALRHGDVALRQAVVGVVVRNFVPALSPLIATALVDADQAIRTQAAAAVAEIEQALARRRAADAGRIATDPVVARRLFALLTDHAEHNVLLSPANRRAIGEEAVRCGAVMLAAIAPGRRERMPAARAQAAALRRVGRAADAVALLSPLVDPPTAPPEDIAALAEALVSARAYRALADLARAGAGRADPLPADVAAMLDFWRDRAAA